MASTPRVRILEPSRHGQTINFSLAEDSLPPDHPARLLWTALGTFDLSSFVDGARAVEGHAGRGVYSPRMMLTLWGFALFRGVVHARKIQRLILTDTDFRWIVGDLLVRRTAISAFLADHHDAMTELLADVIGALMHAGLLFLPSQRLSQDGTRVRANAGQGSFRTEAGLLAYREQARLHLKAVLARLDEPAPTEREQQASERAAMAMLDRVEAALKALPIERAHKLAASKDKARQTTEVRLSTTDPEARPMKLSQGEFGPGYNLQLSTVGDPSGGPVTIVGVEVSAEGNDKGKLWEMREQIECNASITPTQVLVDSDYPTLADVRRASSSSLDLISVVPERWKPESPLQDDVTRAWMARMGTPESHEIYRARKALSERPNAMLKHVFGLRQVPVRGLARVRGLVVMASVMANLYEHRHLWLN